MAQFADDAEGVGAVGGDVYRRVRLLDRAGDDVESAGLKVLALVVEVFVLPSAQHQLQGFEETVAAFALVDAVAFIVGGHGAAADAENGAALRQDVQGGGFLGHADGLVQGDEVDGGADADAAGGLGDGGADHEGGGHYGKAGVEVEFGQPGGVETQFVGPLGLGDGVLVALGGGLIRGAGHLVENAEFHGLPLNRGVWG